MSLNSRQLQLERDKVGQIKSTNILIEQYRKRGMVLAEMLEEVNDSLLHFQLRKRELIHGDN